MDGYANLIAARLRKLAATGGTGVLPVSGPGDGAFFLRGGQVVHAESSRTSPRRAVDQAALGLGAAPAPGTWPPGGHAAAARSTGAELVPVRSAWPADGTARGDRADHRRGHRAAVERVALREVPAIRRPLPIGQACPLPVAALLTEVERRHHVLRQLAAVITADTPVARNASPGLAAPAGVPGAVGAGAGQRRRADAARPGHGAGPKRLRHHDRDLPADRARAAGRAREARRSPAAARPAARSCRSSRAIHNGRGSDA